MDNTKKISKRAKGGLIASAITLLVALLTFGVGNAFGAEGGLAGLLKKAVGDVAAPVMNAASGGMLQAESLEGTAYAVLDSNGTLTFIRSTETVSSNATEGTITDIANVSHEGTIFTGIESNSSSPAWQSYKSSIKRVESSASQTVELLNVKNWFSGCSNLESANLAGLSTGNVRYFEGMFTNCSNLKTVNVEALDTSSATTMYSMFEGCSSLTSIDVRGFVTSHVTNMNSMFLYCDMLTSLDLSSFDTSGLTYLNKLIMPYWGANPPREGSLTQITFGENFTFPVTNNNPAPLGSPYTTNWIKVADAAGNPIPDGEASPVSYSTMFGYTTEKAGTWQVVLEEGTKHTVTFEVNGGQALSPRLVLDGGTVSKTASRSGYTFAGWYTDEELTASYDNAPIYDDITLYAKWTPAPARISYYDAAGGYQSNQTVPAGETFTPAVDEPTLAGCQFAGWYTDLATTTPYDFTVPVESNANIKLYPKFIDPSTGEKVTAVSATFQGPSYETVSKQVIPSGSIPEQPVAPTVAGATFDGWYYAYTSNKYGFDEPLTSNANFQAKYLDDTSGELATSIITLTFRDLGIEVSKQVMVSGSVPVQPDTPDPGIEGVVFAGWYGSYGNASAPYDFTTPQSSSTGFEAKYKSASTDEVVDLVGLNFYDTDNTLLGRQILEKGSTPTLPADPVKAGYDFEGWYANPTLTTPYDFGSAVTANRLIYAKFVESAPSPATGSLSITNTVTGDGAPAQALQFTVTLGDNTVNDTFDGVTFTNGVATVSLASGQTANITGLPAGVTYVVAATPTDNFSSTITNGSGTIGAGDTTSVSVATTYTAPAPTTGSLSITNTVTGDGAPAQPIQFTVTLGDNTVNGTFDGVTFTNGVATVSLASGVATTIAGLPAGTTYAVAVVPTENFNSVITNGSGTIGAGDTTSVSVATTYTAPAQPATPNTVNVSLTRDDDGESGDPVTLTLVEVLASPMTPASIDTSGLTMTVGPQGAPDPATYTPTPDANTNALVYNFSMDDGDTMSVPLVEGSTVTITNTSATEDITKEDGTDGTQTGQMLTVTVAPQANPVVIRYGASPKSAPAHTQRAQGWIRVNTNTEVNDAVSYEAFKVFDAEVNYDSASGNYNGTHIEWESDTVKAAVMNFLNNADNRTGYDNWLATKYDKTTSELVNTERELAQNAAEYIALMIGNSAEDTTANTTPKTTLGDSFASKLATVLRNYGLVPVAVPANTNTTVDQGYYVVATATSTIGNNEAGTAPIWAPVPATGYTVEEKVSKPTFDKRVKDNTDDTENFNKVADASTNQWLDFRLTTRLPANLKAFPTYPIQIVDAIPETMTGTLDGLTVSLDGTPLDPSLYTATMNSPLTITISDVLTLDGVDGGSVITVDYKAKLNANAVKGSAGNPGTATLTYPADTMTETTAQLTSSATVLTYQLRVDKVDAANRLNVDNAQFNAKTTIGSTEYWIAQDGTPTTDASQKGTWTTTNGTFTISGIDEGTYSIIEAQAPEHYETIATPLSVTIDAQKDYAGGTLTALGVSALSGANGNLVSPVTSAADDGYVESDLGTGIVRVRISDVKQIVLPLTGMPVKTLGIIVGVGIAIASVAALVVKKRNEQNEEDFE